MNARDLEPYGPDSYPDVVNGSEERRELFRLAAVNALKSKSLDPKARAWADAWASIKPLGRALSDGAPAEVAG
jgi:hypothetical protein